MITIDTIKIALNHAGFHPFRHVSCHADINAQRNLQGITHYVDADTLKYFKSRILDSGISHDGLVFWLVESKRSEPGANNKRFVAFDVFGTQLFEGDSFHKTSKAAWKEGSAWLAAFDALSHTETALRDRAVFQAENAQAIFNALNGEGAK